MNNMLTPLKARQMINCANEYVELFKERIEKSWNVELTQSQLDKTLTEIAMLEAYIAEQQNKDKQK